MKPTDKCEMWTQFCRRKATMRVRCIGKGAPKGVFNCCMACFAILNRSTKQLKQV